MATQRIMRTSFLSLLALSSPILAATSRTTEANEATITDPTAECSPYGLAAVNKLAASYPTDWVTADLQFSGVSSYDVKVFNSISAGIPNIAPRGTRAGDFSNVTYSSSDPYCWWSWNKCTTPKLSGLADDVTKCPEPNTWGYTLDDGPNCSHNAFYDYLTSVQQKATLFYIGSNVIDWPLEAQRGLTDGHELCSHTWSHPYMTSMTNEQAFAELYYSKKIIKDVTGVTVRCWRPPYGDVDDRIRYIATALDLQTMIWEEDTFDYNWNVLGIPAVNKNYQDILDKQAAGDYDTFGPIVLSHEIDGETMALSEKWLPTMRAKFPGGVVPIGVCMNNSQPYVEQGDLYVYPTYEQYTSGTVSISVAAPTAASKTQRIKLGVSSNSSAVSSASLSAATGAPTALNAGIAASSSKSSGSSSAAAATTTAHSVASRHAGAGAGVIGVVSLVAALALIL